MYSVRDILLSIFSSIFFLNQIQIVFSNSEVLDKSKLFCLHPLYPCYYYSCNYVALGIDLNTAPAYKCPKGLIFDEAIQRCTWVLPWQTCNEDETSRKIKVLKDNAIASISSTSTELKFNNIETNYIDQNDHNDNDSTNKNDNNIISNNNNNNQKNQNAKDITKDYLINILTNFGKPQQNDNSKQNYNNNQNLTYLSINEANLKLKSQNILFNDDLSKFYPIDSENNKKKKNGQLRLFNGSIENNDENIEDVSSDDNEYAFIIVPVKVPSKEIPKPPPEPINFRNEILQPSTENFDDNNLKSVQSMFQYKKVCYVTNWSQYRPKDGGKFSPDMIDPFLCTHIIYAFAYIDNVTLTIKTIEENDEEMYRRLNNLKYKNPRLKTMLGIGGWNMESDEFSAMVSEKKTRLVFIYHAMKFLRHHGFDGIDLDWEFPADRGGIPEDKQKLTFFIHEFRQAINDEILEPKKDRLIISAAVAAGKVRIDKGYEISQLAADLDFINLMTFDYHGSWDPKTGLNAPLYSHENETGDDAMLNQDWSVSYWISHGCPPHKLVLGVPAYGRTFTLKDEKENGIGAESLGSGIAGNFTKTPGFMSYYECCALRKTKDWTTVWLSQSKSHYMFNKNQWVSYDDIKSFHLRTAYVVAKKLGGLFIWSLDMDDFTGKFCDMGSFPLIKNSMSLLMDYMPEFYSSNVNPAPKAEVKSVSSDREPSNLIYLLKEDDEKSSFSSSSSLSSSSKKNTIIKTVDPGNEIKNQIQKDLLLLLRQQPQKFLSYNLIDKFNCTNKQNGIHRDPYSCDKFYVCNNISKQKIEDIKSENNTKITNNIQLMKEFSCPKNTSFTMNGCFCEKINEEIKSCPRITDTLCRTL